MTSIPCPPSWRNRFALAAPLAWLSNLWILAAALSACPFTFGAGVELRIVDGATTVRRVPGADAGRGGGASALQNGDFSHGLDGWSPGESGGSTAPGTVAAEGGSAVLREGDSFLTTLSQGFMVPADARRLSFGVSLVPGFDRTGAAIPDAFEVSLLDADLHSIPGTWSDQATSFLSFQEDGTVLTGPGVVWDGAKATVEVPASAAGRDATLFFDFIGADDDIAGAARIDDVQVTADEGFLRGNANLDGAVNITDPIVILGYLFLGSASLHCLDAADANDDGIINITDPIFLLGYLFLGTETLPPPYPSCGLDPGPADSLDCQPCSCPAAAGGSDCP